MLDSNIYINFKSKPLIYASNKTFLNNRRQEPRLISKGMLKEFLDRKYNLITNQERVDLSNFYNALTLFAEFEKYEQKVEVINHGTSYNPRYEFHYHFLSKFFTKKCNDWKTYFTVIDGFRGWEFTNEVKAPLLDKDDLKSLKVEFPEYLKLGQDIAGNKWYYCALGSPGYCLPLKELVIGGFYKKANFELIKDELKFKYTYENDYKTAGSGWYKTEYYEGYIDLSNWQVEEKLVDSNRYKWD